MSNLNRLKEESNQGGKVIRIKPVIPRAEQNDSSGAPDDKNVEEDIQQRLLDAQKELEEAEKKAAQMIDEANQQIEQNKKDLEKEIEQKLNDASQEGYEKGFQKGMNEAETTYENLLQEANDLVDETKTFYFEKLSGAEEDILKLALNSANKIVQQRLEEDESSFVEIIKHAVQEVMNHSEISVYVNPDSYQFVLKHQDSIEQIIPGHGKLWIYPKRDLPEYGCLIESPYGTIDASVDTQLKELEKQLNNLLKGEASSETS
ncbi:flagellar assembly protein FliH [Halalkalibacillus sediminis]|uniref:flagellar assembly protein FliH n=1 Tax=Halalkalibacillus sediminis TaxID=2018042 RepID=UPI00138FF3EF|nr:flagellar assembly protein FliH [Halalkalibacillus sediminis]